MNIEAEERVKFAAKFGKTNVPPSYKVNPPKIPNFEEYCKKLRKRKFFRNFATGSDEYVVRMAQARALYKENFGVEAGIVSADRPAKKKKRKKEVTEFQVEFARNKDAPWNFAAMRDYPVRVETVREGGQAYDAGVEVGDLIISVDGVSVDDKNYMKVFKTLRSGSACIIVFRRTKVTTLEKKRKSPAPATSAPAAKKAKTTDASSKTKELESQLNKVREENLRLKLMESMKEKKGDASASSTEPAKKRKLGPQRPGGGKKRKKATKSSEV